jgi:hypothetical protein
MPSASSVISTICFTDDIAAAALQQSAAKTIDFVYGLSSKTKIYIDNNNNIKNKIFKIK